MRGMKRKIKEKKEIPSFKKKREIGKKVKELSDQLKFVTLF